MCAVDHVKTVLTPARCCCRYNQALLRKLAGSVRINVSDFKVFHLNDEDGGGVSPDVNDSSIFVRVNRLISKWSRDAVTIFFPLPPLPGSSPQQSVDSSSAAAADERTFSSEDATLYMQNLQDLTKDLPPVVLVRKGKGQGVISTEM